MPPLLCGDAGAGFAAVVGEAVGAFVGATVKTGPTVQVSEPAGAPWPSGQAMQAEAALAPVVLKYVFTGQGVQALAPVAAL